MLTRRTLFPVVAGGLLAPCVARADLAGIEAAARKEGAVTWYTAHTDGETAQIVADAFTQQINRAQGAHHHGEEMTASCSYQGQRSPPNHPSRGYFRSSIPRSKSP